MSGYEILISDSAINDMRDMIDILSEYYSGTAVRKYDAIMENISKLAKFPYMCEVYHKRPQYRRLAVEDYLIFYTADDKSKTVHIYRILYARRNISELID